jgi:hypothetical protein
MKIVLCVVIILVIFLSISSCVTIKTPIVFNIMQNEALPKYFEISSQTHGGYHRWLYFSSETDMQIGDLEYATGLIHVGRQKTIFNNTIASVREGGGDKNILRITAFINEGEVKKIMNEIRKGRSNVSIEFEYGNQQQKNYIIIEEGISVDNIYHRETLLEKIGNFILAPFFRNMKIF